MLTLVYFPSRGNGSTSTTTVNVSDNIGYYNPTSYGRKSGFSYCFELQAQRVTKLKYLFGFGVSYGNLKSKAIVDSFYDDIGKRPAAGKVLMANTFITVNPYIGQRFVVGNITFDALIGIDWSFSTKVCEEAKVISFNQVYRLQKADFPIDIRPMIQTKHLL